MGNSVAVTGRRRVKVMKITGETLKLRVPLRANDVTKDHPGHVLLDAEAVKHFGIRANPLEPQQDLKPKRVYFLVEIPKFADADDRRDEPRISSRRVQSGINMTAKDRLECLMLSRRSVSDMALVRTSAPALDPARSERPSPGPVRVRMRLPKSQVAKIVEESKDEVEVTEKIIEIYMRNNNNNNNGDIGGRGADVAVVGEKGSGLLRREEWKSGRACVGDKNKAREKRVSFLPIEGEIRLAVDS